MIAGGRRQRDHLGREAFVVTQTEERQDEFNHMSASGVGDHVCLVDDNKAERIEQARMCQGEQPELLIGEEADVEVAIEHQRVIIASAAV